MAEDYTIGRLAEAFGLSRSTLLYYDRIGLLRPINRSHGNYRLYSATDFERLRRICTYREVGIPLKEIAELIDQRGDSATESVLEKHLQSLEREIESLRTQQRQVVRLLDQIRTKRSPRSANGKRGRQPPAESKSFPKPSVSGEEDMITKDRWVEIMRAAGLSDDDMHNWHRQFERLEPDAHQEFLESLGIEADEIRKIRAHFRT
jgi:DNA-binding transcriptional MerR regulator